MKDIAHIYDHRSGETIIRELTDDEQELRNAEVAAWHQEQEQLRLQKEATLAKLAALGLNEDDLKVLGL